MDSNIRLNLYQNNTSWFGATDCEGEPTTSNTIFTNRISENELCVMDEGGLYSKSVYTCDDVNSEVVVTVSLCGSNALCDSECNYYSTAVYSQQAHAAFARGECAMYTAKLIPTVAVMVESLLSEDGLLNVSGIVTNGHVLPTPCAPRLNEDADAGRRYRASIIASIATSIVGLLLFIARYKKRCLASKASKVTDQALAIEVQGEQSYIQPSHLSQAEMIDTIGHGSQATVMLAKLQIQGQGTALIFAAKEYAHREAAQLELQVFEKLPPSEHIVRCYGCAVNDKRRWFLALEYCRYGSLASCLQAKQLPRHRDVALRIFLDILGGLRDAHSVSVVHRDLKPANVLLTCTCPALSECSSALTGNSVNAIRAKLTDFGMAKVDAMLGMSSGNAAGTIAFLPPERMSRQALDADLSTYARSDLYSFGLIAWEVMYYVITGESMGVFCSLTMKHSNDLKSALTEWTSGSYTPRMDFFTPEDGILKELISRCLAREPSERFHTAGDALQHLRSGMT